MSRPNGATDVEVCVVGAGPHGLATVAHVLTAQPSLRNRIAVVDPAGEWLSTWRAQFARLGIDVLRSPVVHHPGVDPAALAQFVSDRRLPRSGLPYDPPLAEVFSTFCDELIDELGVGDLVMTGGVRSLEPTPGAEHGVTLTTDDQVITARHVVWAANTCRPTMCDGWPTSSQIRHASQIDLRSGDGLDGRGVVIVGGGLTAGHLALGALRRGAHVTLVTRRPIVERDFDVDPGWLGPKYLTAFWRERDHVRRVDQARLARGGGSMPAWMLRRLDDPPDRRLQRIVGEIDALRATDRGVEFDVGDDVLHADECWLATGTTPDVRCHAALAALVDVHADGLPAIDPDLRIRGTDVFVSGRLATTELGPAAGNLWGARNAARRISRAITGIDLDTDAVAAIEPPPAPTRTR